MSLLRAINKLSLISRLKLLESLDNMVKSLKLMFQSQAASDLKWPFVNLGTGIGIGTDITNAIISTFIMPMDPLAGW